MVRDTVVTSRYFTEIPRPGARRLRCGINPCRSLAILLAARGLGKRRVWAKFNGTLQTLISAVTIQQRGCVEPGASLHDFVDMLYPRHAGGT